MTKQIFRYDFKQKFLESDLSSNLLKKFGTKVPVVVCLGSDKVLSDMVGVLVAENLKKNKANTFVFGGLDRQIMAKNVESLVEKFPDKNILFVDSGMSKNQIVFDQNGIRLNCGKFFDGASITAGTISKSNGKFLLATTSAKTVFYMAKKISDAILEYLWYVELLKKWQKTHNLCQFHKFFTI